MLNVEKMQIEFYQRMSANLTNNKRTFCWRVLITEKLITKYTKIKFSTKIGTSPYV